MRYINIYMSAALALATGITASAESTDSIAKPALNISQERIADPNGFTGAVATATADDISQSPTFDLKNALFGHLAGYYNSGEIRGVLSVNGEPKLLVVDGIPSTTRSLSDIDPTIVESVQILKDAAAKAIYGPLGAQGVILVNTKRGVAGQAKVSVTANFAFQSPTTKADMLGSYDYAVLRNQALANDGLAPAFTADQIASYADGTGLNNDWRDMYLRDFRTAQRYNIQLTGGNKRVRYYVNAGFQRTTGLYKTEYNEKYNPEEYTNNFYVTSNLDITLFPFLSAFVNSNVNIKRTNGPIGSGALSDMYKTPPTAYFGIEDDKIVVDPDFSNPIYGTLNYTGVRQNTNMYLNASFGLDLDMSFLTKGLSLKGILGYSSEYAGSRNGSYNYTRYVRNADGSLVILGSAVESTLSWSKSSNALYFMNFQALLDYKRTFGGQHYVAAQINYLAEDKISGNNSAAWLMPFNRIQLAGEAKYGFDSRYYVAFAFNYAGSEQLPKGNRFHFSPTVSGAWVVSNESFMRDVDWLQRLKVRASYGVLNYDNMVSMPSRYTYSQEIRTGGDGYIYGLYSGAIVNEGNLGNPFIHWEKDHEQNYGIDFTVFHNLSVSVDYYRQNLHDMICRDWTTPTVGGYQPSQQRFANVGRSQNQGVDIAAKYNMDLACGLGIDIYANVGWNKNKIIYAADMNRAVADYAYPSRISGYSRGQIFGYVADGFYNSEEEIANSGLTFRGITPRPGDLKYKDLNGDKVIDDKDLAPLDGVKDMPSMNYGFGAKLTYRGFDLYAAFQGEAGRNRCYSSSLGVCENVSKGVYLDIHKHAWTPERYAAGEEISYPALTSSSSSSLQANTFFVSKDNFLRLRNLTVGYSLPESVLAKLRMTGVRFYVTGENLFVVSDLKFKGFDPEATGIAQYYYRSVSLGLNFTF